MVSADPSRGWADSGLVQNSVRGSTVASRRRCADYAGRGVLVCGVARMVKASLVATAYHEAGHATMRWHYATRILKVTIAPDADSLGSCRGEKIIRGKYPDVDNSYSTRFSMEKQAAIKLAGPIAQKLYNPRSFRNYHASSDYVDAADIALRLNTSEDALRAWLKWLEIRTRDQLRTSWDIVDRIAKKLLEAETLNEQQVRQVIFSSSSRLAHGEENQV